MVKLYRDSHRLSRGFEKSFRIIFSLDTNVYHMPSVNQKLNDGVMTWNGAVSVPDGREFESNGAISFHHFAQGDRYGVNFLRLFYR